MKASNISSVDKTFVLLEFLAASGKPASLQEVTAAVQLPKPTVCRLLATLQKLGYVSRPTGSRNYLVGPSVARLAAAQPHAELKTKARPLLQQLHEEFNETVNLGTLSGTEVIYIDFVETTKPLRFIVTPGQNDPYYCTALGRAVASRLTDKELDQLLALTHFPAHTTKTVKTRPELQRRILKARQDGYAEEIEEAVQGVSCMAVSLAAFGFPEAAISMAVPVQRLTPKRKAAIIKRLKTLSEG